MSNTILFNRKVMNSFKYNGKETTQWIHNDFQIISAPSSFSQSGFGQIWFNQNDQTLKCNFSATPSGPLFTVNNGNLYLNYSTPQITINSYIISHNDWQINADQGHSDWTCGGLVYLYKNGSFVGNICTIAHAAIGDFSASSSYVLKNLSKGDIISITLIGRNGSGRSYLNYSCSIIG